MRIRSIQSLMAAVLIVAVTGSAMANYPHSLCRWLGSGWSDGYHSHAACPPRPHAVPGRAVFIPGGEPNSSSWWTTPATGTESVPTPGASPPANDSSLVGPGTVRR